MRRESIDEPALARPRREPARRPGHRSSRPHHQAHTWHPAHRAGRYDGGAVGAVWEGRHQKVHTTQVMMARRIPTAVKRRTQRLRRVPEWLAWILGRPCKTVLGRAVLSGLSVLMVTAGPSLGDHVHSPVSSREPSRSPPPPSRRHRIPPASVNSTFNCIGDLVAVCACCQGREKDRELDDGMLPEIPTTGSSAICAPRSRTGWLLRLVTKSSGFRRPSARAEGRMTTRISITDAWARTSARSRSAWRAAICRSRLSRRRSFASSTAATRTWCR